MSPRILTIGGGRGGRLIAIAAEAPPPELVFSEDFAILGNDANARTQGGRWTSGGTAHDIISGASVGATALANYTGNVMRFDMAADGGGLSQWGQMHRENMVPVTTDHWIRYGIRNDAAPRTDHGTGHNIGRVGSDQFQILADVVYGRLNGVNIGDWLPGDPWMAGISVPGPVAGSNYPFNRMYTPALSYATWYDRLTRIQWHPSDPTLYRAWPYVYAADGVTLIYGPDDFTNQGEVGTTTSIVEWYDIGGAERWSLIGDTDPQPQSARHWGIGTEGPADGSGWSNGVPRYRYIAAVRASITGDPGPWAA